MKKNLNPLLDWNLRATIQKSMRYPTDVITYQMIVHYIADIHISSDGWKGSQSL
jgi:hypothetical protein